MHAVPTIYNAIATAAEKKPVAIPSLRVCVSGGAPLPAEIRERFQKLTGCRIIEGYGLTEASPAVASNPPDGEVRADSVGIVLQAHGRGNPRASTTSPASCRPASAAKSACAGRR